MLDLLLRLWKNVRWIVVVAINSDVVCAVARENRQACGLQEVSWARHTGRKAVHHV